MTKQRIPNPQNPSDSRIEKDSLGEVRVPNDVLFGAQTQRAVENFNVSDLKMPRSFLHALALIKYAAAKVNYELNDLPKDVADAIMQASLKLDSIDSRNLPVDVFQTGSGTSTNMNVNEVIAHLASEHLKRKIHPNDEVNKGQSSNDVIPSAIHLSASIEISKTLLPSLIKLKSALDEKAKANLSVVKTGRTHLMDALPMTLGQEISGWAFQIKENIDRIKDTQIRIQQLCLGGTAIGTGLNANPKFGEKVIQELQHLTKLPLTLRENLFAAISAQDTAVELSDQLKVCAISLTKISNDLRWMNSGPVAGLSEIKLKAIQPGSSIMPGKVNPVIPEAVCMASAQVMGNATTVMIAGASGNFQLNTMLPVIGYNVLQSIQLIANSAKLLADAISDFTVNEKHIKEQLLQNPILVTALNPYIGYEKSAEIAKKAYHEKRPVLDVAREMTQGQLSEEQLQSLLDPHNQI